METIDRKVLVSYGSEPTRSKVIHISESEIADATFLKANIFYVLKAEHSISLLGGNETSNEEDVIIFYDDQDFGMPCELPNDMRVQNLMKLTIQLRQPACKY